MRRLHLALLAPLTACAMYGAPAANLKPVPKLPVPVTKIEPPAPVPYVETCNANFHDSHKVTRSPTNAKAEVNIGGARIAAAEKRADPAARAQLILEGLDHYRAALIRDPFDADATLQLALAYDKVLHKGCALKLLDRLAVLSQHPQLGTKAKLLVQDVEGNDDWFKGYRTAAKDAALGVRNP